MAEQQQRLWNDKSLQPVSSESAQERLVRYYPPTGSNCSLREPDMWPSFWSSAKTVQELMPQLRKDVLIPEEFGLYVLVPFQEHAARMQASSAPTVPAPTRWALASDLPHGVLPPGPVDIRVVAAPSKSPGQPLKVSGPWGPIWL